MIQNTIIPSIGYQNHPNFISFHYFFFVRNFDLSMFIRLKLHAFHMVHIYVLNWFQLHTYIGQCVRVCLSWLWMCVSLVLMMFTYDCIANILNECRFLEQQESPNTYVWTKPNGRWWWLTFIGQENAYALPQTLFVHTASHIANKNVYYHTLAFIKLPIACIFSFYL